MAVAETGQRPTYQSPTPQRPPGYRRPARRSLRIALLILVVLVALLAVVTWEFAGNVHHQANSISASGVRHALISLNMGAGHMHVSGTAAPGKSVQASFDYNTPGVTWDESHFAGSLTLNVSQKDGGVFNPFKLRNDWTIRLGRQVPVDLRVNNGAGDATLNLRQVDVRALDVNRGIGALSIDLRQPWKSSLNVKVQGGVGETTIHVPTSVGVLVHVQSGVGSMHVTGLTHRNGDYVNGQYGRSPVTLNISVDQGVGTIDLTTR